MIEITYDRARHRVTVTGHAQCGEKGHDLVCAAASMLTYTLAENVQRMCGEHSRVRRPKISLDDGSAEISCSPVHGMGAVTTLVYDAVCAGFDVLAAQYPENVRYTVSG